MLAIGRALMSRPKLLLLDEPSMGLSPIMVQEIGRIVLKIVERGVPVVLVEQNAELALRLARYAYVFETGSVALHGEAARAARQRARAESLSWRMTAGAFAELLAAGWSEADLGWETACRGGDGAISPPAISTQARDDIRDEPAHRERRISPRTIPALGTSLANHGAALVAAGKAELSGRTLADAVRVWRACDPWVAEMTAPRVARSSLFHMRMEQRHRPAYEARWRVKWGELVEEARGDRSATVRRSP